ncbi:MAG: P1 family peptidase [Phormidesmis sp. CAN_BIN44]|nr:P1 family peptidase [Phormidesmis sp. CAN_BIN44]
MTNSKDGYASDNRFSTARSRMPDFLLRYESTEDTSVSPPAFPPPPLPPLPSASPPVSEKLTNQRYDVGHVTDVEYDLLRTGVITAIPAQGDVKVNDILAFLSKPSETREPLLMRVTHTRYR